MERLTGREGSYAYILKCFAGKYGCANMDTKQCDFCNDGVFAVCNRLAEYEDTGLAPEDIKKLKEVTTKCQLK
jgi:hypothetical protein